MNVLDADEAMKEWLARLEIFDAVQLQRVRHLAKHTFRDFQPLGRQFVNLAFRLEITRQRDKDGYDEPAEEPAQNEDAKIFPLRRTPRQTVSSAMSNS